MTLADSLEYAMGTMTLERMSYFAPSRARVCENPTRPILAGMTGTSIVIGCRDTQRKQLTSGIVYLAKASVET